jgi:hypothetical protein
MNLPHPLYPGVEPEMMKIFDEHERRRVRALIELCSEEHGRMTLRILATKVIAAFVQNPDIVAAGRELAQRRGGRR